MAFPNHPSTTVSTVETAGTSHSVDYPATVDGAVVGTAADYFLLDATGQGTITVSSSDGNGSGRLAVALVESCDDGNVNAILLTDELNGELNTTGCQGDRIALIAGVDKFFTPEDYSLTFTYEEESGDDDVDGDDDDDDDDSAACGCSLAP